MQSDIDQTPVSGAAHAIKGKINRIILTWKVFAITIPIILKSNMVITESSHNIDKPSSTWRCLHEHSDISFTLRQCHGVRANVKLMSKCWCKHQEYWANTERHPPQNGLYYFDILFFQSYFTCKFLFRLKKQSLLLKQFYKKTSLFDTFKLTE